jgi:hypothetical protein
MRIRMQHPSEANCPKCPKCDDGYMYRGKKQWFCVKQIPFPQKDGTRPKWSVTLPNGTKIPTWEPGCNHKTPIRETLTEVKPEVVGNPPPPRVERWVPASRVEVLTPAPTPTPRAPVQRPVIEAAMPSTWTTPRTRDSSKIQTYHLEEVRDMLRARKERENPQDYERLPTNTLVKLSKEISGIQFAHVEGAGEPHKLHPRAFRQLASFVGEGHAHTVLKRLMRKGGADGEKVASMAMHLFNKAYPKRLKYRVATRGGMPVVRAVLSEGYCTYDHLDLANDTLTALGDRADKYRVIDYSIGDDMMSIRLLGGDDATLEAWEAKEINWPFPIVELGNSETGDSSVFAKGGTFTLWCSNGCGHWDKSAGIWRRRHVGRTSDAIRNGLVGAITDQLLLGEGITEAYGNAMSIQINDAYAWFLAQVEDSMTTPQKEAVRTTMMNNSTVNGGGRLLASVVDAVTWVAHEQGDRFRQQELETLGGQLLHRGIQQAEGNRIHVALA